MARFHHEIAYALALAVLYTAAFGLVVFVLNPLQSLVLPEVTNFASLVFVPHGLRVMATVVMGARAIPGLFLGALYSTHFIWGMESLALSAVIALEHSRLAELRRSITEEGYLPDTYEHIEGHFFRRGQEFRFFVRGGKHRAAVLAFLGHELIPVRVRASWPRAIEVGQEQDWPFVASGELDVKLARGIFEKYFDHE
jgi:hypothetical protein